MRPQAYIITFLQLYKKTKKKKKKNDRKKKFFFLIKLKERIVIGIKFFLFQFLSI